MPTTTDYVSSVSMLPTVEFLELVAKKQWDSTVNYGLGFSTITPLFGSTTNSEWLCFNSEAEFLENTRGTVAIKNPFAYTRPESSPVYIGYNDITISSSKLRGAKSLFLFRIGDGEDKNEVITVSNYGKMDKDTTTAPPIDCFSRECLTWFSSDVDWFTGFGQMPASLPILVVDNNGALLSKSEDIIEGLIDKSSVQIGVTSIQVINTVSELSPYVVIEFATGVGYSTEITTPTSPDTLFLFSVDKNNDSVVAFAYDYNNSSTTPDNLSFNSLTTKIYFDSQEIIVI